MATSSIPTRGIVFYSRALSVVIRGPSQRVYYFYRDKDTPPVENVKDIAYFRKHPDTTEKGDTGAMFPGDAGPRPIPLSYTETNRKPMSIRLDPPTEQQLEDRERRMQAAEAEEKEEAEKVAVKATAEAGIGTERAQKLRKYSAEIAAGKRGIGDIPEETPKVHPTPALRGHGEPVKPPQETASKPKTVTSKKKQLKLVPCRFCDKSFTTSQGATMHESRYCLKNSESEKSLEVTAKEDSTEE